jgi:outer membrane protein assembly factor BamE (lipoprotein component of BamABCDE complex)
MKKISGICILVSTVAVAVICGCASNSNSSSSQASQPAAQTAQTNQTAQAQQPPPKKKKGPIEDRLVVGMTMDQVKDACGNPKNVAMNSDGSATWIYDNSQNSFIPFYMETGNKIHHVVVYFDTNGKVKSWSATDSSMY